MFFLIIVDIDHFGVFEFVSLETSLRITMHQTLKFLLKTNQFCLPCNVARKSFRYLLQNLLLMCCVLLRRFLQYRLDVPNTPGGDIITLGFLVNRWLGESATSLFALLVVPTTKGFQLITASTSKNKVFRDSTAKLLLWVLRRDVIVFPILHPHGFLRLDFLSTQSDLHSDWQWNSEFCYDSPLS